MNSEIKQILNTTFTPKAQLFFLRGRGIARALADAIAPLVFGEARVTTGETQSHQT